MAYEDAEEEKEDGGDETQDNFGKEDSCQEVNRRKLQKRILQRKFRKVPIAGSVLLMVIIHLSATNYPTLQSRLDRIAEKRTL